MNKAAVINASPLIFLTRGGHMDLLKHVADHVFIPESVAHEIQARGSQDRAARAIEGIPWLEIVQTSPVPAIQEWGLGPGETAVLEFAYTKSGMEVIIDDLAGRKCAQYFEIPVRGTVGIILLAKKRNVIPSARSVLEDLIRGGLYLSRPLLDEVLKRVGE